MTKQLRKIKLEHIRLETCYRKKEKDLSLELDLSKKGLIVPLTVEREKDNQYVLVDGYRRFNALEYLGKTEVDCFVEIESSEEERLIKRLGKEFHTKKRTAYQLERIINRLLDNGKYNVRLIASLCNVKESTITKYVRGSEVNPEWLRRAEKTGAGRHALTEIHFLNVSDETKNYIAERYIDREIPKTTVDVIKKATNDYAFRDISTEAEKECVDEIIKQQSKNYENVKTIVNECSLQKGYSKNSHTYMHHVSLNLLTRVENILRNKNYFNYLSNKQMDELNKYLQSLLLILNPPINWSEFPDEGHQNENVEAEVHNDMEH